MVFSNPPVNRSGLKIKCDYEVKDQDLEKLLTNLEVYKLPVFDMKKPDAVLCMAGSNVYIYMKLKMVF